MSRPKRSLTVVIPDTQPTSQARTKRARATKPRSKNLSAAGDKKRVKLPYCFQDVTGSTAVGSQQAITCRGNGMFDPDYAVGGHQPLGYDQMSAMYYKWFVKGTDVQATFGTTDVTGSPIIYCCLWSDTSATAPVNEKDVVERCLANGGQAKTIVGVTNGSKVVLKGHFNTTKELNFKEGEKDTCGYTGGDPALVYYIHAVAVNSNNSGGASNVSVQMNVKYDAEFFDTIGLASS